MKDLFASTAAIFAGPYAVPALLLVSIIDASILSLPEACDILVAVLSVRHTAHPLLLALVAAVGSTIGSLGLFAVAHKGGRALLRKRLSEERIAGLARANRRHDRLIVLVTSMLPPPCPFKLFVISSGVFGMGYARFAISVLVGRFVRFAVIGVLAVLYGEHLVELIRTNTAVFVVVAIIVIAIMTLTTRSIVRQLSGNEAET